MAQYESLKSLAPATEDGNGNGNSNSNGNSEPEPKARAKRGRKKQQSDETAIAKSPGHELANKQQAEAAELLGGLDQQERQLTAYLNYQQGQDYAKLAIAARTAGMTDVLVGASLDRIEALKQNLENNLTNHNPLAILDELGLNRSPEETQKLRDKVKSFNPDEYDRFFI